MSASKMALCMIVKNEAVIIERCLASVAPHIDCYVILDTGSTDDTVGLIRQFFLRRGIPGCVHHGSFRNFETTRNEALHLAEQSADLAFDYLLLLDADMEFFAEPGWRDDLRGASVYTSRNYQQALMEFVRWHQAERRAAADWETLQRDDFRSYLRFLGRNRLSRSATQLR